MVSAVHATLFNPRLPEKKVRGSSSTGSNKAYKGHGCKIRFSKEETNRFINEEGSFSCGNHRRDQVCNDCFHTAVANDNERQAFRRSMDRAVKGIWKKIYFNEGDKVPWGQDEDEDEDEGQDEEDEVASENDQRQTEKAPSSSHSREKTCAHCGKVGKFDRCAKCKVTFYCSPSHQAADYAKHKANCLAKKTLVNDTAQPTNLATRVDVRGGPSTGSKNTPNKDEQPPSATWLICAYCGIKSDEVKKCSRCKCTWYCSQEHQRAHYSYHKHECRVIADFAETAAQSPAVPTNMCHPHIMANKHVCLMNLKNKENMPKEFPVISWRVLEKIHPNIAIGRTLEVRIVSEPSGILGPRCDGRDAEGVERIVALMTHRPPAGLGKGCILLWRNPWFHRFAHGGSGANIEHWDMPNVTVSAA